jgi:hypothetical protein
MEVAWLYIGYLKGKKRRREGTKRERLRVRKKEQESQGIKGKFQLAHLFLEVKIYFVRTLL